MIYYDDKENANASHYYVHCSKIQKRFNLVLSFGGLIHSLPLQIKAKSERVC